MPKLKLEVKVDDLTLYIRVLEQDESLYKKTIKISDDFIVESSANPQITSIRLWIRGSSKEDDDAVVSKKFESSKKLNDYLNNLKFALAVINGSESRFFDVSTEES